MVLKIYNTLTRRVEEFKSLEQGLVKMYVCGPTVQDYAHLGHAKTFIAFDVVYRYLELSGYKVIYVRNITDVGHLREDTQEDRILVGAARERLSPMELVDKYMFSFFEDMKNLNVKRPNIQPRASMHIPEMWDMISKLLEKGYAYESEGNIYFDVSRFKGYGQLSGVKMEELVKHRVEPAPGKRNPADFALWKRAEEGYLLKWRSPWGDGFPGWHIECSVMSMKYLGEQIDIHGGAQDLIFPHHENEIAQSESYTDRKPFVRYWMHVGHLTIGGERMSKSLGNFVTIKEALRRYTPNDIRIFVLSSHYRSQLDFSEDSMYVAQENRRRFEEAFLRLEEASEYVTSGELSERDSAYIARIDSCVSGFRESMDDDFNTPRALSHLYTLTREINSYLDEPARPRVVVVERMRETLAYMAEALGLAKPTRGWGPLSEQLIKAILAFREELRARRMYEYADTIRQRLREVGIEIEDTVRGPRVRIKR